MSLLQSHESVENTDKTHRFTCASYSPFEVIHLDYIGPLRQDDRGNSYILVLIDAFSRWMELFATKTTSALETAQCFFSISVTLVPPK